MKALAKTDQETVKQAVLDYEVLDHTASVKLIAAWGIDYMHLANYHGKWIMHILWQTHPQDEAQHA